MVKFQKYILTSYNTLFFQMFFILALITSTIFLIQISAQTALLKINFFDLLLIFSLQLPIVIFFAAPIAFVTAAVINLVRLSNDSELIVFFSLGISPNQILKVYAKVALLITTTLLVFSIGIIPITQQLMQQFINIKQFESELNISSTEFGQKFGEWLMFVNDVEEKKYKDVVLFSRQNGQTNFIIAEEAQPIREFNLFKIELEKGSNHFIDENIKLINFEKMSLNNLNNFKNNTFYSIIEYWSRFDKQRLIKKDFSMLVVISFLPLLSIFVIGTIGIINPRHTKNRANLYLIIYVVTSFFIINRFSLESFTLSLIVLPITMITVSYFVYHKLTLSRY